MLGTDIVILAVNWVDAKKAVEGPKWTGQSLVEATNAHADSPPDLSPTGLAHSRAALAGRTSSEIVAEWGAGSEAGQIH